MGTIFNIRAAIWQWRLRNNIFPPQEIGKGLDTGVLLSPPNIRIRTQLEGYDKKLPFKCAKIQVEKVYVFKPPRRAPRAHAQDHFAGTPYGNKYCNWDDPNRKVKPFPRYDTKSCTYCKPVCKVCEFNQQNYECLKAHPIKGKLPLVPQSFPRCRGPYRRMKNSACKRV